MAVDVTGFRTRFPEFASTADYSDARVQLALDDAALQINRSLWGNKADLGTYYLAAHALVVNDSAFDSGGGSGPVTQESVGQVSRSYAAPGASEVEAMGDLAWTKYGKLYWRLKRQILGTPVVL